MSTKTYTLDQIKKYLTAKSEDGGKLMDAIYDLTETNVDQAIRGKMWKVFGFDNEKAMDEFNEEDTTEPEFTVFENDLTYSEINNTITTQIKDIIDHGIGGPFHGITHKDVVIWGNEMDYGMYLYKVRKKIEVQPCYWFLAYHVNA